MALKKGDMGERVQARMQETGLKKADTPENMKQHNFRMKESEWQILRDHFDDMGLSMGAGLRMVLTQYMRDKGLK